MIQTFLSEEKSEEVQIMGRTARQGKNGSFSMVLCEEELEIFKITHDEVKFASAAKVLYTSLLNRKRVEHYDATFLSKMQYVEEIKKDHIRSQLFLDCIRRGLISQAMEQLTR